jgi:hypothetical protein
MRRLKIFLELLGQTMLLLFPANCVVYRIHMYCYMVSHIWPKHTTAIQGALACTKEMSFLLWFLPLTV